MNKNISFITRNGTVAALYVIFTILIQPLSYGDIQFRFAEILVLLCFFRKDYCIGLIVGCFIANLFSPLPYDFIFGTLATALATLGVMFSKNIYVSIIYPVIINGIIVGTQLFFEFDTPFWINALSVAGGELVVMIIGLFIFLELRNKDHFMRLIGANQNLVTNND